MADIFLSHSREDRETAVILAKALMTQGRTVWWDSQIPVGKAFDEVIELQLASAKCVVVIWSATSVKSHWVKSEARLALSRGVLIPVAIGDVQLPLEFRWLQTAALTEPGSDDFEQQLVPVLQAIHSLINSAAIPEWEVRLESPQKRRRMTFPTFALLGILVGGTTAWLIASGTTTAPIKEPASSPNPGSQLDNQEREPNNKKAPSQNRPSLHEETLVDPTNLESATDDPELQRFLEKAIEARSKKFLIISLRKGGLQDVIKTTEKRILVWNDAARRIYPSISAAQSDGFAVMEFYEKSKAAALIDEKLKSDGLKDGYSPELLLVFWEGLLADSVSG